MRIRHDVSIAVAVGVGVVVAASLGSNPSPSPSQQLAQGANALTRLFPKDYAFSVGQCVKHRGKNDPAPGDSIAAEPCASGAAFGRVIGVYADGGSFLGGPNKCSKEADSVVSTGKFGSNIVCIRYLNGPHPSQPGRGGGSLRVGDCIVDPGGPIEGRCGPGLPKVIALVAHDSQCPSRTVLRLRDDVNSRTICLFGSRRAWGRVSP